MMAIAHRQEEIHPREQRCGGSSAAVCPASRAMPLPDLTNPDALRRRRRAAGVPNRVHPTRLRQPAVGAMSRPTTARISHWRTRNDSSSSFLRRSQPVTSLLHLLVLQLRQAGTTLSTV